MTDGDGILLLRAKSSDVSGNLFVDRNLLGRRQLIIFEILGYHPTCVDRLLRDFGVWLNVRPMARLEQGRETLLSHVRHCD